MQRRVRTLGGVEEQGEVEIRPLSSWAFAPFLFIGVVVVSFALWSGRHELASAAAASKALILNGLGYGNVAIAQQTAATPHVTRAADQQRVNSMAAKAANSALQQQKQQKTVEISKPVTGSGKVITSIVLSNGTKMDIIDEPLPAECHAEMHADYDGYAVQWGLGHKARSAAECCRRCKEFKPAAGVPHGCNIWVWCGDPSGVCWTMDIHKHTTGDCWLKYQAGWDNNVDRQTTNLKVNHRLRFSPEFRAEHKTAPEFVPWIAGLIPKSKQR